MHEIAHIWLGESGVSNILTSEQNKGNNLETYCNRIAAEFLTPKSQFLNAWGQASEPKIDKLSKEFKVSKLVIAIRAYTLGKIDLTTLESFKKESNKYKEPGGDPYKTYPVRNSKRLTRAIVSATVSGSLMLREAASLLNVKPDTVMELSKRMGSSMNPRPRYLLDANVFIQAKYFYYRFEFCEAFWEWLLDGHEAGLVFSINQVRNELLDGNKEDLVQQWMSEQLPDSFFLPDKKDSATMSAYGQIMQWATSSNHYTKGAKDEFARGGKADAFLLASAVAYGYQIVTQEKSNPARKNKIMLPDAANNFDVNPIFIYDFLSQHASGNFNFKQ